MRQLALAALLAAAACMASAQSYFQPQHSPAPQRGPPPPQRTGPVGFTGIPLARFPSLDGGATPPHAFRAAPVVDHDDDDDDVARNVVTPSPSPLFVSRPPQPSPTTAYRRPAPAAQQPVPARAHPQQGARRPGPPRGGPYAQQVQDELLDEEELEEEKPDKLSLLLPQSKFDCHSRKTGYYADDGLNCEVFHYCQDNVRHSWICPEGFLFHQVHLICMPPSGDNICKQSSQFHFVNDYLYRPINAEEAQTKPNVTLRYSDRYYPDNYYEEGEERPVRPARPVAVAPSGPAPPPPRGRQPPVLFRQPGPNQVFHSPEEVNIPLVQRRPPANNQRVYHAPQPQQHQPQTHEDDFEYDDAPFRG